MNWRLFPRRARTYRKPLSRAGRRGIKLGIESLEERAVPAAVQFAVGVVDGAAVHLRLYGADGTQVGDIDVSDLSGKSLPTFAIADVTGDGAPDVVVGSGAGVANRIRVYDGATLQAGFTTSPFGAFNGSRSATSAATARPISWSAPAWEAARASLPTGAATSRKS